MRAETALKIRQRQLYRAVPAVKNGMRLRKAATKYYIPRLWPVNRMRLCNVPRPQDAQTTSTLLTVKALDDLSIETRMESRRRILVGDIDVVRSGFEDTTRGAVLTSQQSLAAAERKKNAGNVRLAAAEQRAFDTEIKERAAILRSEQKR